MMLWIIMFIAIISIFGRGRLAMLCFIWRNSTSCLHFYFVLWQQPAYLLAHHNVTAARILFLLLGSLPWRLLLFWVMASKKCFCRLGHSHEGSCCHMKWWLGFQKIFCCFFHSHKGLLPWWLCFHCMPLGSAVVLFVFIDLQIIYLFIY